MGRQPDEVPSVMDSDKPVVQPPFFRLVGYSDRSTDPTASVSVAGKTQERPGNTCSISSESWSTGPSTSEVGSELTLGQSKTKNNTFVSVLDVLKVDFVYPKVIIAPAPSAAMGSRSVLILKTSFAKILRRHRPC